MRVIIMIIERNHFVKKMSMNPALPALNSSSVNQGRKIKPYSSEDVYATFVWKYT